MKTTARILLLALAFVGCAPSAQYAAPAALAPSAPAQSAAHPASRHVFAQYQPNTLQGTSSTGYSLYFATAVNEASISCRGGEYWVRPFATSSTKVTASGANTAVTTPVAAPVEAGWIRMLAGDTVEFGSEGGVPMGTDPITQIDIYCVTGGTGNELMVNAH